MPNVLILQTDNRTNIDFIGLSKLYNSKVTAFMQNHNDNEPKFKRNENINYRYEFFPLESKHYENMHNYR